MYRFGVIAVALLLPLAGGVSAAEPSDFERDIGPLIARRCAGCHNATEHQGGLDLTARAALARGGESGPALVPEKPDDSLVWQRIAADEMPPKSPLREGERLLIRAWIAAGATWRGGQLDPLAFTSDTRAGYDWWSLQPLRVAKVEASSQAKPPSIDSFIQARLASAGLSPSAEADRRTLIRRLYFGLHGVPPEASVVARFLADSSPDAYERLVERLLASPAYGERWARHWLDIVRFGESQGFERDRLRTNSWRYRDWVIEAFNRDLPYDEFVRLQVAGDALRPNDAEALIATGFLVAGTYDEVGQGQQSLAMRAVVRQDELEDLIGTVGQTFLGLTVNCARCHDHKFDTVRQSEYYRLAAALAGVRHGEPTLPKGTNIPHDSSLVHATAARLKSIDTRLAAIEGPIRQHILAGRKTQPAEREPPRPFASWEFDEDGNDSQGRLPAELFAGALIRDGKLILDGTGYAQTKPLPIAFREKTLEAWVVLDNLRQQGGGVIGLHTVQGGMFDAIVYAERKQNQWLAGSNNFARTRELNADSEQVYAPRSVHVAVTYGADGSIQFYRDGRPYGESYRIPSVQLFDADKAFVAFGIRHFPPGGSRMLHGAIDRARLYDRALSPAEIAASAGIESNYVEEREIDAQLSAVERAECANLRFERTQLREDQARIADRKVYAVKPGQPEETHLLNRGNPGEPRELVTAGGIASLRPLKAEFGLDEKASDADRRAALAYWLTDVHNPLFARVMVNRLWHYHFGVGLVDTPNDFGFNGGRPSHPELLDWLAAELIRSGWSMKHVQRLIVHSATYRQASRSSPTAMKIDAGNRLLWRFTPQRLDAETLRDSILEVAGKLEANVGGPGYYDFTTYVRNSQFYDMRDPAGPTFERRTIYRTWGRSARSQLLDVFDCPDPSTKAPQRAVTTTPLQALSLSNNSFVLRMAEACADTIRREVGPEARSQVRQLFERAYGRSPAAEESRDCEALVGQYGLAALCRVVFNSNEFLYVD